MSNEKLKRRFLFEMTDPSDEGPDDVYRFKETIDDYVYGDTTEIEYILEEFKKFLFCIGWNENQISRIQFLEPKEWKHVLTEYGEWDLKKEEIFKMLDRD